MVLTPKCSVVPIFYLVTRKTPMIFWLQGRCVVPPAEARVAPSPRRPPAAASGRADGRLFATGHRRHHRPRAHGEVLVPRGARGARGAPVSGGASGRLGVKIYVEKDSGEGVLLEFLFLWAFSRSFHLLEPTGEETKRNSQWILGKITISKIVFSKWKKHIPRIETSKFLQPILPICPISFGPPEVHVLFQYFQTSGENTHLSR